MLWICISRVVGLFMITASWIVAMIYYLPTNWVIVGIVGQAIVFGSWPVAVLLAKREAARIEKLRQYNLMTQEERDELYRSSGQEEKDKKELDKELDQLAKAQGR